MNKLKASLVLSAGLLLLPILGCAPKPFFEPPSPNGTSVPGESLTDKLAWLDINADSRNTYIIGVNADENVASGTTFKYKGAVDITIVLRGVGGNRVLRLASHGTMFTVPPDITFILDENITLMGHSQNTGPMVSVDGGKFVMRSGSSITGNEHINRSGKGGGVYVRTGIFEMTGGVISGNTANDGGGVYLNKGSFTMFCGMISDNIANSRGGGVYSASHKTFNDDPNFQTDQFFMKDGIITGNTARKQGGGIYYDYYSGNVYIMFHHGGVITAHKKDDPPGDNVVMDADGTVCMHCGNGHAYWAPPEKLQTEHGSVLKPRSMDKTVNAKRLGTACVVPYKP